MWRPVGQGTFRVVLAPSGKASAKRRMGCSKAPLILIAVGFYAAREAFALGSDPRCRNELHGK